MGLILFCKKERSPLQQNILSAYRGTEKNQRAVSLGKIADHLLLLVREVPLSKGTSGAVCKRFFLMPEDHPKEGYDHIRFEDWLKKQSIRFAGGEQFQYYSVAPLRYGAVKAGIPIRFTDYGAVT